MASSSNGPSAPGQPVAAGALQPGRRQPRPRSPNLRDRRARNPVIVQACLTGDWAEAEQVVVEEAKLALDGFEHSLEFQNLFNDPMNPWAVLSALAFFDPMKRAIRHILDRPASGSPQIPKHIELAGAYSHMLTARPDLRAEKTVVARKFRDVLVVACIIRAGTHSDEEMFEAAVENAFRRPLRDDTGWARNMGRLDLANVVRPQMFHSYHTLLFGVDSKFPSGAQTGRRRRPARPRAPGAPQTAGDTMDEAPEQAPRWTRQRPAPSAPPPRQRTQFAVGDRPQRAVSLGLGGLASQGQPVPDDARQGQPVAAARSLEERVEWLEAERDRLQSRVSELEAQMATLRRG